VLSTVATNIITYDELKTVYFYDCHMRKSLLADDTAWIECECRHFYSR